MGNELFIVIASGTLALIGTIVTVRGSRKNSELASQLEIVKSEATSKAEVIKTEVQAKADNIKQATEKETKRIDQLIDATMKLVENLQHENRQQREEMTNRDLQHAEDMNLIRVRMSDIEKQLRDCLVGRGNIELKFDRLQAEYAALETQFKGTEAYRELHGDRRKTSRKAGSKIKGEISGEVVE